MGPLLGPTSQRVLRNVIATQTRVFPSPFIREVLISENLFRLLIIILAPRYVNFMFSRIKGIDRQSFLTLDC